MRPVALLLFSAATLLGVGCLSFSQPEQRQGAPQELYIETQTVRDETDVFTVEAEYPRLGIPSVDAVLEEDILESMERFREQANSSGPSHWPQGADVKHGYWVDYDIERFQGRYVSVIFTIAEYTAGAAHQNVGVLTYVIDTPNAKFLSLEDMFREQSGFVSELSRLAQKDLLQQAQGVADDRVDTFQRKWIEDGAAPDRKNFRAFAVTDEELLIFFAPYQVAAYAEGVKTVTIPLEQLQEYFNEELFE